MEWTAKWIDPEQETQPEVRRPAGYLRKVFTLEQVENTTLYATAHGLYHVTINGAEITKDVLTPGCDQYDKRLCYQSYDVTDVLREGQNEIRVALGDGWYRGCNGIDGIRNLYGADISFLMQLEVAGRIVLTTDETWEGTQCGPIRMTDMELGEQYDARMEVIPEDAWHGVQVHDFGYETLLPSESVPIREKECFQGKCFTAPNGDLVFDFGQNLAGYTTLYATAHAGDAFTLVHGETLDENGNFTIANFQPGDRNQSGGIPQELRYICKEGANKYKPRFSMFGYRYAKLTSDNLSNIELAARIRSGALRVESCAVYSDMRQTAFFECSDPAVNKLFDNSVWSMKSNFCDLPTDCPTRERAGWTGDAGVFAPTGSMLMDSYPVFRKWLANVRLGQHEDGKMAYIAPQNGKPGMVSELFSASVGWGDAAVLVPYALYQTFGKKEILIENYDMMCRWVDFLIERAKAKRDPDPYEGNPYQDFIINTGMDYGEWCEPGANVMQTMQAAAQFGQPEVATAYFARSSKLLSEIASLLGRDVDAAKYAVVSEKATLAYRSICVREGHIESKRQCEYVRPLAFGLLTKSEAQQAAADLNAMVIANDYHLNTGFLSTPYLCEVLADYGYVDTAYRLLLQKDCPGWLYSVQKGATTIWETWDGVREDGTVHDSLNHYSYGAVSGWLLRGVCGIRYTHDRIVISPVPCRQLRFAKAEFDSPRGSIRSAWEYQGDGSLSFAVDVPAQVEAELVLPDGTKKVLCGGHFETVLPNA